MWLVLYEMTILSPDTGGEERSTGPSAKTVWSITRSEVPDGQVQTQDQESQPRQATDLRQAPPQSLEEGQGPADLIRLNPIRLTVIFLPFFPLLPVPGGGDLPH